MNQKTMAPSALSMAPVPPTMAHKEIPGNPSTAKSSQSGLNDRSDGKPLQVLSEADWTFWIENGYVIIRNAVPRRKWRPVWLNISGNMRIRTRTISQAGINAPM